MRLPAVPTIRLLRLPAAAVVLAAAALATAAPETAPGRFDLLAQTHKIADQDAASTRHPDGRIAVTTGHKSEYPGVALKPASQWNLSPWSVLAVTVKNTSQAPLEVSARVDSLVARDEKDEPHSMTKRLRVSPGETQTLEVALDRNPAGKAPELFGMRGVPPYAANKEQKRGDPARVTQVVVFLARPTADHTFDITAAEARTPYVAPVIPDPIFPLIDRFGQHVHADWPGKTRSVEDLHAARDAEAKDLAARPAPAGWNEFGGHEAGPQLEATGFFRTEKHAGKWWLVDPAGKLFWSHGITCVDNNGDTPIDQREHWFDQLPARDDPVYKSFFWKRWPAHRGFYAGKPDGLAFNFAAANLLRKYGAKWQEETVAVTHARLRSWGLNTMGNWSSPDYYLSRKTPYTVGVHYGKRPLIEAAKGYWGQFPDPFDPAFRTGLEEALKKEAGKAAGDKWCIGIFIDNELSWGDGNSLALSVLQSPPTQAAKKAFIAALREKYPDVAALNAAWGTTHADYDALLAHRTPPDARRAAADLDAFTKAICDAYFRECRDGVRRLAPRQLYLGCRFAWSNDIAQRSAAEFCDVVSYNLYRRSIAAFKPAFTRDLPIMNTEWHLGARDRGLFHPGLIPVKDQAERGKLYAQLVREHLEHPQFVGCHWFQYRDQATTGRTHDGENYQIGFVDICDTPYPETVSASREVGYRLYHLRK